MSTEKSSHGLGQRSEIEKKLLSGQTQQWRDIGISAVAAAARQASEKHADDMKPAGEPGKIVTLRDIDHLAA